MGLLPLEEAKAEAAKLKNARCAPHPACICNAHLQAALASCSHDQPTLRRQKLLISDLHMEAGSITVYVSEALQLCHMQIASEGTQGGRHWWRKEKEGR